MHLRVLPCIILSLAAFILAACQPSREATPAADAPSVVPTAVVSVDLPPTATPLPTNTPLVVRVPDTPTPLPTAPPPTATPTMEPTATPTEIPPTEPPTATPTPTVAPPPWDLLPWLWDGRNEELARPVPALPPLPPLAIAPGAPDGYLDQFRMIAFYGSPEGPGLGVLGNQTWRQTLTLMRAVIAEYAPHVNDRYMIPTYHAIATTAKPCASHELCRLHVNEDILWSLVTFARNNGAAVVLDIQPGRASIQDEFNRLREFLYEPHVHLAIDPEFRLTETQEPNINLGSVDAADINWIQEQMNQIALELGVNRVLIVHQFKDEMITNKPAIVNYPHVELVIDGDGYGPPGPKIRNYQQYAAENGFDYGGFKLFTDEIDGRLIYDSPFMLPAAVIRELEPDPVVIIYQ